MKRYFSNTTKRKEHMMKYSQSCVSNAELHLSTCHCLAQKKYEQPLFGAKTYIAHRLLVYQHYLAFLHIPLTLFLSYYCCLLFLSFSYCYKITSPEASCSAFVVVSSLVNQSRNIYCSSPVTPSQLLILKLSLL